MSTVQAPGKQTVALNRDHLRAIHECAADAAEDILQDEWAACSGAIKIVEEKLAAGRQLEEDDGNEVLIQA